MPQTTQRGRDMFVEREVAKFLDEHLYSNPMFTRHDRTDEIETQMKGSDIILSIPSKGLYDIVVDEKAMTTYYYMKRSLPTFALELSFLTYRGEIVEGWFTDKAKTTEYYLCIWVSAKKNWFTKDDIKWLEYALVKRSDIQQYLDAHGYSVDALKAKDKDIRQRYSEEKKGVAIDKDSNSPFYFYYSPQLAEHPINIVIRKPVYRDLAIIRGEYEIEQ